MSLHLHGLGHFHPENEITNHFLEELDIGTTDQWILERTGIRSRRTALSLDYIRETRNRDLRAATEASAWSTAQMGARAAEMALERAGVAREDVGLVLSGHTHAGQIRVPRLPVLVRQSRYRLDEGRYRAGATELVVSRGLGVVGLPCRLACPPEAVLLRLKRAI